MATSSTGLSTMEQMLESLKKQEEKLVSDFLPPLPLRPLSKARLPSKCRMRIAASAVARGDSFCALTKITRLEEFSRMTVQRGIISIQSAFRSHTKRIKFKKLRSYTIFLQALVRSRIARKEYLILKERNKAASTIQKEIRSRIARKNYATTLEKSNINSGKVSGHFDSVQDKEYDKRRSAVSQVMEEFEQGKYIFNDNANILLEVKLHQTDADVNRNEKLHKVNSRFKIFQKTLKDRFCESKTTVQKLGQNIHAKFLAIQIVERIRNKMQGGLQLAINTFSNRLRMECCCGSSIFTELL